VSLRLILVGAGTQREELEPLAAAHGLRPLVRFTGVLQPSEFAPYLRMADIGLSPYCGRVEFSGLKLLDYKAAGLATIASGQAGSCRHVMKKRFARLLPGWHPMWNYDKQWAGERVWKRNKSIAGAIRSGN
jgi:glycosyltransferase involved in cell wall biosynthesis